MKRFVLIICALVSLLQAHSEYLNIEYESGNNISIALSDKPQLIFHNENIIIKWDNNTLTFPFSNITKFSYDINSGISDKTYDICTPIFIEQGIYFNSQSDISIIQSNGICVFKSSKFTGLLPFSKLPNGILILSVNSSIYKFINHSLK